MTDISLEDGLSLSVVVPVLNERQELEALIANLNQVQPEQVVFVDGGSDDGTYQWLEQNWQAIEGELVLLQASSGRAAQMNHGAEASSGDVILFLHADTRLPIGAKEEVFAARKKKRLWGRFDVCFPINSSALSMVAYFINARSRITGIATGDQAIFVDTNLFKLLAGYEKLPLMEDVAISKRLKQHCQPYCSRKKVITSARRWQRNGVFRTIIKMWLFRLAFFFGVPAERLARSYHNVR